MSSYYGDIPSYGVGHVTTLEGRSRKKKQPLGFAPPQPKAKETSKKQKTGENDRRK